MTKNMIVSYIGGMNNISPSQRGRPREFDTERALQQAVRQFSVYGYHGTSIADLNRALNLTSGSIYKAWGDKRGLFLATLDYYIAQRIESVRAATDAARSGREKVYAFLAAYAKLSSGSEGRQGCLIVGTAVELSAYDDEIARRLAAQQQRWESQLSRLLEEGQQDGSVSASCEPAVTATLLIALTRGMRVLGKTGASEESMTRIIHKAMCLLD
ncbi:TetR/AcrR family transcriptional regulator [Serratia rubidaea]|uniref:TetR/AcrR family transcriptional regulator n=1 Tax=Serratia rubidaea TaxID=61652 RepID=UPI001CDA99BA|nr:TetR/AcrR family transcriptional regulator [Serratia rubidaea]